MEEVVKIILIAGSSAAALTLITKAMFKSFLKDADARIDFLDREIQRLILYSENMPIEERLSAGQRYVESGGKVEAKVYYEKLLEKFKEEIVL